MRFWCQLGSILGGFWPSWGGLGASWGVLGASWGLLGASWGHLGASWSVLGRLGRLLGRPDAVLEASWAPKDPQDKPDSTWNGKRRSFKGSFMQKPYGTILDRKASSRSRTLRSLRSLRSPCGFSLGFRWGFARFSLAILDRKPPKRSANLRLNLRKIEQSTPTPSRIDPRG